MSNKRSANAAFSNSIDVTPTKIFSPGSNFNLKSSLHKCKKFNDPIHNHISFEGLALKIIDTPEFQRLSHLLILLQLIWVRLATLSLEVSCWLGSFQLLYGATASMKVDTLQASPRPSISTPALNWQSSFNLERNRARNLWFQVRLHTYLNR
jgi:hypothetical protein